MYECCGTVYARFNEEPVELVLVDSDKDLIEIFLCRIQEELLQNRTVSVRAILDWNGDYEAPENYDNYIIDNVDEFNNTYVKWHKYGYISNEYVATIQGIKRAP